jgi:dihydroorotase-like cyclic amidohydrolase
MLVSETGIYHRHKACPYNGETMHGFVKQTIVAGETVFADGKLVHETDHPGSDIIRIKSPIES